MNQRFQDRADAGRVLASRLGCHAKQKETIVLGIARGGVMVARELAACLHLPLDVLAVRRLGHPGHENITFGAITSRGGRVVNPYASKSLSPDAIAEIMAREIKELTCRESLYHAHAPRLNWDEKTVLLVDDGIVTSNTICAAVQAVRSRPVRHLVVAAPVISSAVWLTLERRADEVVAAIVSDDYTSLHKCYENFAPVTDVEVARILEAQRAVDYCETDGCPVSPDQPLPKNSPADPPEIPPGASL